MAKKSSEGSATESHSAEALVKQLPVLFFLIRQGGAYKIGRRWGIFDTLGVRAIDDLTFIEGSDEKKVIAFTEEPPHASDIKVIAIPTQVALERSFFHLQGVSEIVINPRTEVTGVATQQKDLEFTIPDGFAQERRIMRVEMPEIIGAYALPKRKVVDMAERGERAFRENSLFEALCLARRARQSDDAKAHRGWFIELMAMSFMGLPEDALALYEQYPLRGSSEPEAQLVGARYRLLLKQLNEARTVLHTLTFHEQLGAIASCELARSYVASGEFDRAIDIASSAIQKDPSYLEAHLVRGVAQRGLSYPAGEEEGLKEALKDLEKVAAQGGFSAPEALFHAGTVFGRLGALEEAEVALRQSLFQRDRYASRDALVRVVCASRKFAVAKDELDILCNLAPSVTEELRREIESHVANAKSDEGATGQAGLWSSQRDSAVASASNSLKEWKIPLLSTLQDFALLDDFINRYAPAGEFMAGGDFGQLYELGSATAGRAISLHLGWLLVSTGLATWEPHDQGNVVLKSKRGLRIPLESFVEERLLLGASGDNFSSLESLVAEINPGEGALSPVGLPRSEWWHVASAKEVTEFHEQAEWARNKLVALGADFHGSLQDLEEIDRIIEHTFELGGLVQEVSKPILGSEVERFVVGLGFFVGTLISQFSTSTWFTHELPEGFSLVVQGLGRIFPVSLIQRRAYLSTAASDTTKLGSFAFGVAAAVVAERIKSGIYPDRAHAVTAFRELLPSVREFSESELDGVVDALFERSRSV